MKDFIKNFIERNKPIFTIGVVTLLLFVAIIVFYRFKSHTETKLNKIGNESTFNVVEEEKANMQDDGQYSETQPAVSIEQSIDEKAGILEIEYTSTGFKPETARAIQGQAVRWTNKTDKTIYLKQKTPTYTDLTQPVQIEPEQSFSYRLNQDGTWNYEEELSRNFASIVVYKLIN